MPTCCSTWAATRAAPMSISPSSWASRPIRTNTFGQSKGRSGSFSKNEQQLGRELLTPDEIRMLDNKLALLFVRGERPILDG
ncbi:type IV secretory system conjugative DNA transfer family protein, partial [Acutalibacter sp. 1XD8-36]|uniref:type IV secretory system conjugative DNA transfer family protein n=1 Tax=Acutalibacter sp. 1XD8-36 TaxID=2320852 RepID=UPI003FA437C4